ncbi:cell division protein FtsB [Shewanella yunxiaonensis]|uniref:Cell division protein FtsB n=1 Tax=Shewanella yunxiaonensis TaxID=2829809 RepID=A0ABX7YQ04_9GAMM|nr:MULTISPECIES: cell division protein FtsB [Shewanella]MDF0534544.1 cell division protein FtsB [Shewanella sp. A32]QUN04833.1 cell division protein FtsB [Shewanella yunxiaonensis]
MKPLLLLGCLLLGLMQYRLWWGENSLTEYYHLDHQIAEQQQNNDELDARNQALKEEISDLRSGKEAIEERARNELGLIKKGETFYRVVGGDQRSMTVSSN